MDAESKSLSRYTSRPLADGTEPRSGKPDPAGFTLRQMQAAPHSGGVRGAVATPRWLSRETRLQRMTSRAPKRSRRSQLGCRCLASSAARSGRVLFLVLK